MYDLSPGNWNHWSEPGGKAVQYSRNGYSLNKEIHTGLLSRCTEFDARTIDVEKLANFVMY